MEVSLNEEVYDEIQFKASVEAETKLASRLLLEIIEVGLVSQTSFRFHSNESHLIHLS